jgi:hypothetical protein
VWRWRTFVAFSPQLDTSGAFFNQRRAAGLVPSKAKLALRPWCLKITPRKSSLLRLNADRSY